MSTGDAWLSLCSAVAALSGDDREVLVEALLPWGLTADERDPLARAAAGRPPGADVARALLAGASDPPSVTYAEAPRWSRAEVEHARAVSVGCREQRTAIAPDAVDGLWALPPGEAGDLVSALVADAAASRLADVIASLAPHRLPVTAMLELATGLARDDPARSALLRAAAASPRVVLLRGVALLITRGAVPPSMAALVVVDLLRSLTDLAGGAAYQWWPSAAEAAAGAGPTAGQPRTAGAEPPTTWRSGGLPSRDAGSGEERPAYPRIDVVTGTSRPDVVVVDEPFEVRVGIQPRRDRGLVSTAPFGLAPGVTCELVLVLLHDPDSIHVAPGPRATVTVSDADPYPSVSLTCTARFGEELGLHRRIGLQVTREGQVVAVAWRTVVAVDAPDEVALAPVVPERDAALVDLAPLLGGDAPDLVISVCRGDAPSSWTWCAFSPDPDVEVPDLPGTSTLDGDIAAFALETRRSIAFSTDPSADFLSLAGRARRIGRAVPPPVQDALLEVVTRPGRDRAPAVLLLTEELVVPWELARLDADLDTPWGGTSPFLGAHAAIGRWPLTEHRPRPQPRTVVPVRTGAVLTADYTGVPGWGRLDAAVAEADTIAALFDPPATMVPPDLWTVIDVLRGLPAPADVLHVALHGQYDAAGDQEGIVLLGRSTATGAPVAQFLTPAEVENGALDHGPLVFLNACQVGTDERVLGDYAGFASTLLRIGAAAVVAPLWNILDDIASSVAHRFYAAALGPETVPVAEVVRALRATYTEEGVRAGDPSLHATLVAYQVFGHPRLRLLRADQPPATEPGTATSGREREHDG